LASVHPLYERLGGTPLERQHAYAALFDAPLEASFIDELRAATNGGWAFGNEKFKRQIATALG
jgi:putative transposase